MSEEPKSKSRRRFLRAGIIAGVGAGCLGYAACSNALDVEEYAIQLGVSRPLRIALITDLHAPSFNFSLEALHHAVREAKPDVVAVVGDTVDVAGNEHLIPDLLGPCGGGVATLGNWEYWGKVDLDALETAYASAGFELLRNRATTIHGTRVLGLDDLLGGAPDYELAAHEGPQIVLSHCPATAQDIVQHATDPTLILAGHTHGGQIAPLGIALKTPPGSGDYVSGLYPVSWRCEMIVSRGLGNSVVPFRVGTRPTLVLVDVT